MTDFEQQLLRSADQDRPSDDARAAALAALGLGTAVVATTAVAKTGLLSTLKALPLAAKLVTATVLVAGATTVVLLAKPTPHTAPVVTTPSPPPPRSQPAPASAAVAAPAAAPDPVPAPSPVIVAKPLPLPKPAVAATPAAPPAPAPSPSPIDPLSRELALIDLTQAALRAHDPATALARLADHSTLFPGGALAPEAGALQIEALLQAHRTSEAHAAATTWLAAHGSHPLAPRVRALIE